MRQVRFHPVPLYLAAAAATAILYLGWTSALGAAGYPLDDAWIHQTLARNLARLGQWAYYPGEATASSTSPLWTLLLAPGHLPGFDPRTWTLSLGISLLVLTAWWANRLAARLFPEQGGVPVVVGAAVAMEWHLGWAALSGMETLLFVFLSLLLVERVLADDRPGIWGIVAGLLTLTRPEGALLMGLICAGVWFRWEGLALGRRSRARSLLEVGVGFAALTLPYLAFHLIVADRPLPNTFYAKHQEYLEAFPAWALRPVSVLAATLIGGQVLLLPGFVRMSREVMNSARLRLPLLWWAGFLAVYAAYLPLTYQHGRYLIPTIPLLVIVGIGGTAEILKRRRGRLLSATVVGSLAALWLSFWVLGARAYAQDVRIIDTELVAAGRWLAEESPADVTIGAHDIGAIAYFSERRLIDTAGLISPEVIPFIRDEKLLLNFLEENEVAYFVSFPSWYPHLVLDSRFVPVYRSPFPWSRAAGGEPVVVYETRW